MLKRHSSPSVFANRDRPPSPLPIRRKALGFSSKALPFRQRRSWASHPARSRFGAQIDRLSDQTETRCEGTIALTSSTPNLCIGGYSHLGVPTSRVVERVFRLRCVGPNNPGPCFGTTTTLARVSRRQTQFPAPYGGPLWMCPVAAGRDWPKSSDHLNTSTAAYHSRPSISWQAIIR